MKLNQETLKLIDHTSPMSIYLEKDDVVPRSPFEFELRMISLIIKGKDKELSRLLYEADTNISIGRMSFSSIRQAKYSAVAGATLSSRASILGGLNEERAYALSDAFLQEIDVFNDELSIYKKLNELMLTYAKEVKRAKELHCSYLVKKAIDYIDSKYRYKISLDELSEFCECSKEYLSTTFKKQVGQTISKYLLTKRIEEAKKLIEKREIAISNIGLLLGFCSQSHFISSFKKVTSMTPKEYSLSIKIF